MAGVRVAPMGCSWGTVYWNVVGRSQVTAGDGNWDTAGKPVLEGPWVALAGCRDGGAWVYGAPAGTQGSRGCGECRGYYQV